MKRLINHYLKKWKNSSNRKPLLLRGARQVGKTYAIRELGKSFSSFIEINFELNKEAKNLFEKNLDPERIFREISTFTGKQIEPGKTLLFFDEVQSVPDVIIALRYFYEIMPELHVIAAGSLLDFAIEKVGVPVGRVQFLYMYPMSFLEFLAAMDQNIIIEHILKHSAEEENLDVIHNKFLDLVGQYMAIGGMPQAILCWKTQQNLHACAEIPQTLTSAYQYDFIKYGKNSQIKYLDIMFSKIPQQLGKKFKYSQIGEYRKRELEPCLDLLVTAGIIHKVLYTAAQGIPLGAQVDLDTFKIIFLDVGLTQFILGLKTGNWILDPLTEFNNRGMLVESFVGQEIIAYENPTRKSALYYWKRDSRSSEAEVDYVLQYQRNIIPIEVKSGKGSTLKSMQLFLETHKETPYGIRFSSQNYSIYEKIHSYPLYAIAKIFIDEDDDVKESILQLIKN
ncbi:hypothetical protein A3F66_05165 [candidate division TM6 bacterium RIFCSPHIGHO2_12_FULL_32_22]|nr:MAG: hypothetical protein A3F66_05165 [candidate division TM6 bacterium RIFCSPHIGHO2_12_FULL_32_22]